MPKSDVRIVSLIASATEIAYTLGLGDCLVGRSHECDFPPEVTKLPCCTAPRFDCSGSSLDIDQLVKASVANALSVYEVFDDVLERLQPTHILTQTQCEVCAVSLRDVQRSVARRLKSQPHIVALEPNSLADVWTDIRNVALSVGVDPEPAIAKLQSRMGLLSERAYRALRRPRVACIEWIEPLMAAGNWVPELVEMANGENLFGEPRKHSPWMSWDDLVNADPDVVIIMPCGFDIPRTCSEMHWRNWNQLHSEIYIADGNQFFNRPGPRVVESLEILVDILHAKPEYTLENLTFVGWNAKSVGDVK